VLWSSRRQRQRRSSQLIAATLVASIGLSLAAVGASANPDLKSKREQAKAVLAEVQRIDAEVGDAAERWNGANYKLAQISAELSSTRRYLVFAQSQLKISRARAGARLRELYMHGERASAVEVILGAKSLDDVLERIDAANRITAQDARLVRELERYRTTVAAKKERLAKARAAQVEIVRQRAAEKHAIEAKLAERKRLLASVQDEVRQLEAEERRRQAELRRQALAELARQRQLAAEQARAAAAAQQRPQEAPQPDAQPGDPTTIQALPENAPIPVAPPADASKGAQVVAIAIQYLGAPYVWGGASPSTGFDCSGFTMFVFAQIGISLPHYAAAQYGMGVPVSKDQLQPGDLVFFHNLGHMGMYIGSGNFIHAPHTGDVVKISSVDDANYAAGWVGARRVL